MRDSLDRAIVEPVAPPHRLRRIAALLVGCAWLSFTPADAHAQRTGADRQPSEAALRELAKALGRAGGTTEREALLARDPSLVTAELVKALSGEGDRLLNEGHRAESVAVCRLAQEIGERIGDTVGVARALNGIGNVHFTQGDYRQSLEHYEKSLALLEALGDARRAASALGNLGNVQSSLGNYVQAQQYYERSLATREALGDREGAAMILNNIGIIHFSQGNYALALEYCNKSLAISEALGNRESIAHQLLNTGTIHRTQGNYGHALERYQQSLQIYEDLSRDTSGPPSRSDIAAGPRYMTAQVLHELGNLHSAQGNYLQAMAFQRKSLATLETLGRRSAVADALSSIGSIELMQRRYADALAQYERSLALKEALDDRAGIATVLGNIAEVHRGQGDQRQALSYYRRALDLRRSLGDQAGIARALGDIGSVYDKQGLHAQALESVQQAAALAREIGMPETLWQASFVAGVSHRALGREEPARTALEESIATIETLRDQVAGGEQERQRFFESRIAPYHAMIELLVAQNRPAQALVFAERAKSRVLLDVLHGGRIDVTKAMTSEEQARERRLNNALVSLNSQIYRERLRAQPDPARLTELEAGQKEARLALEAFEASLYATHSALKAQRGKAPALTLQELDDVLPDAGTALLEFVVAERSTYVFVMTRQAAPEIAVYRVPIAQDDLTARVARLRQALAGADTRFARLARELHELLLQPAAPSLRGKRQLVIVPDGPLWELPAQALRTRQDRYVIDDHALFYAPSLTVLREMIRARPRRTAAGTAPLLLALGNPALGATDVTRARATLMGDRLEPLPDAERQVMALARIYGRPRSRIYVGADAREERFKAEAGDARVLHLATHGVLNDRSPMYSHLLLAHTGAADPEDGLLEAWELIKLDLRADLAVLSACETARGRVGRGEGIIGLTWALFVAGVPSTVVSGWKVRSDSTTSLMIEFHRQLVRSTTGRPWTGGIAAALRASALKVKRDPRYQHPFHWAGFTVVGNGY